MNSLPKAVARFEKDLKMMPFHIEVVMTLPHEPSIGAQMAVKTTDAFKQSLQAMDPSKVITIYKKESKTSISYAVVYLKGLVLTVTIGEREKTPFFPEWRGKARRFKF